MIADMPNDLPPAQQHATGQGKTRWWFIILLLAIGIVTLAKALAL